MSRLKVIGLVLILIGIGMLLIGGSLFTYSGPPLNPIINNLGKYSFLFWLPVLIVGIAVFTWPQKRKKV
jgi:hypothetical protein